MDGLQASLLIRELQNIADALIIVGMVGYTDLPEEGQQEIGGDIHEVLGAIHERRDES